ncbi:MAG TPA: serine hydrolase [Terriglobales bacterium]|nr:serine hydrolase [Terriglobales bacterium]
MTSTAFTDRLTGLAAALPGKSAVAAVNLETGERIALNEEEVFPCASIIKLPILCTAYAMEEAGELTLSDRIQVSDKAQTGGDGVLRFMQEGLSPTLHDLATLMVILSDNMATNMVVDAVTPQRIHEFLSSRGLNRIHWRRKMMDTAAMAAGIENEAAAGDVNELMKGLAKGTLLSPGHCKDAIQILLRQQVSHKFPRLLWRPYDHDFEREEIKIAHKTGDMPGLEHDAGVFYGDGFSFALTVMTVGPPTPEQSVRQWAFIGEVAEAFVRYWDPQSRS